MMVYAFLLIRSVAEFVRKQTFQVMGGSYSG